MKYIRNHWNVENRKHNLRDLGEAEALRDRAFKEDGSIKHKLKWPGLPSSFQSFYPYIFFS